MSMFANRIFSPARPPHLAIAAASASVAGGGARRVHRRPSPPTEDRRARRVSQGHREDARLRPGLPQAAARRRRLPEPGRRYKDLEFSDSRPARQGQIADLARRRRADPLPVLHLGRHAGRQAGRRDRPGDRRGGDVAALTRLLEHDLQRPPGRHRELQEGPRPRFAGQ